MPVFVLVPRFLDKTSMPVAVWCIRPALKASDYNLTYVMPLHSTHYVIARQLVSFFFYFVIFFKASKLLISQSIN